MILRPFFIIWVEAPMTNEYCFKTIDQTLRDILRFIIKDSCNKPFGGLIIVLGGDFRKTLPIMPKGIREEIMKASIKESYH